MALTRFSLPMAIPLLGSAVALTPIFYYALSNISSPPKIQKSHSLAALPKTSRARTIYAEDCYPGGQYANFPMGQIRYWLFGPEDGKKVVLIHGFSYPALVWKDIAPLLASAGFRVLVYDLYGRGYTEAPHTTYTTELFVTQLALLLQHVKWDKARLVGMSMGGAIAVTFAAQFPGLVDESIALVVPVGLLGDDAFPRSFRFRANLFQIPILGALVASRPKLSGATPSDPLDELVEEQKKVLPFFERALASSLLHGPIRQQHDSFRKVGQMSHIKTFIIVAGKDTAVPSRCTTEASKLLEGSVTHLMDDADHDCASTHAEEIFRGLVGFL